MKSRNDIRVFGVPVEFRSRDPTLRSSNTTVRAVSFHFNLSSDGLCFPVQTSIVPVYRRQAARSAANMFRRLARSAFLYHIFLDSFVLEF